VNNAAAERSRLLEKLLSGGPPTLWCPPLTHYRPDGSIDHERIAAHLASMAPYVKGVLVPGSTGDGWELTDEEAVEVLSLFLDLAPRHEMRVLVGALATDHKEAIAFVERTAATLCERSGGGEPLEALAAARVCGFALCPPKGPDRSQQEIASALEEALVLGLPLAIYQLPQVTENEVSPQVVADLASRYPNLVMLKDSSGRDRVATSGLDLDGMFVVRGAEGDYHRWLKAGGGPYDGFLLSTANCFAPQLSEVIELLAAGHDREAQSLSERLTRAINAAFDVVRGLPCGNIYANANKAIDHFLAFGPEALDFPPPRLHAGLRMPRQALEATGAVLSQFGLLPARGYLEDAT